MFSSKGPIVTKRCNVTCRQQQAQSGLCSSVLWALPVPLCSEGAQPFTATTLGSTCAPEVLILTLNDFDTKINKIFSLHYTGLQNYGYWDGYAITTTNLRSPKQPVSLCPQPPSVLDIGSMCVWECVCLACACEGAVGEVPPHSCSKVRQHRGD